MLPQVEVHVRGLFGSVAHGASQLIYKQGAEKIEKITPALRKMPAAIDVADNVADRAIIIPDHTREQMAISYSLSRMGNHIATFGYLQAAYEG